MTVTLREITMDNFRECIKLSVAEAQKGFVASNMYSLAEAQADGVSEPRAIYAGDQMVGFIMVDFEPKEDRGYISRLMVAEDHQGNGYGREAMRQVIERFKRNPACKEIQTAVVPENVAADTLYRSLGFEPTGEMDEGEAILRMTINRTPHQSLGL
ncbi:GNAT family N-acetyltransferase [Candidatus Bipolaricaulota bacterium]|nr:GNAT family N-acetyltransferase [Candidatus Bipolaricaulota bacterium]